MSGTVTTNAFTVYVAHNDYETGCADRSDFVCWWFVLEFEQGSGFTTEAFVSAIGKCLETLWGVGFRAVAACNFEEHLPDAGGINLF